MIGSPPNSWTPTRRQPRPTVEVCIATGYECEPIEIDADECRELSDTLYRRADELSLERVWRDSKPDRMTNVDESKQSTPFVPTEWKLKVGIQVPPMELFQHQMIQILIRQWESPLMAILGKSRS